MRKNKLLAMAVSAVLSLTMCLSACASDDEAGTGGDDQGTQQTTPGGTDEPGGEDNPGGTTEPGGEDNPGGTDEPGGEDNPGGTDEPGGEDTPPILDAAISYCFAGNESAALEWDDNAPSAAKVEYKPAGGSSYAEADGMLIRAVDADTARVDVVGLKGGETYDFKITTSGGQTLNATSVTVGAYDRSGYAHFNYDKGVGAYNDDGTLKDGALVIYLTDENKNDISDSAYVNGVKENIDSLFRSPDEVGIGYFLNNRQYSNAEKEKYGIQAATFKYGAVAVRVLGKVNAEDASDGSKSLIEGLTAYNSTENGGTKGDNGRMARMVNAKNLTIEGIGTDACVWGWGFHFVSNDNLHKYEGSGKSFEVRNITFANYPEDAVGMEGTQGTKVDAAGSITSGASDVKADLISPVERCWIHHNTFLPGYCANPAESDKAEGDGSCDFKRGQYYTASYNYFEYCHKTNLIGSSDSSLQFNISLHHNWWNNCGSRIPLIRNANAHFYNNYISGDSRDDSAKLSYVTSARANCYLFAEANYYDGCKSVAEVASGGVVKAYNNMYYACFNGDASVIVEERDAGVQNNCKFTYRNMDYSGFDTDPELFYYDAVNKVSDCYITSPVQAREEVMINAGVLKYDYSNIDCTMNETTPSSAVSATREGVTIDLGQAKDGSVLNGVVFTNGSGSSSGFKGKGQLITFTLARETDISVTSSTTGENAPELLAADGTVWAAKFKEVNGLTLPAGTYFIATGLKDKEAVITSLTFVDGATDEERVAAVEEAIGAIPATVTLSDSCIVAIEAASAAYNALADDLKPQVDGALVDKLNSAVADMNDLLVADVERLIDAIGTVAVGNDYHGEIETARAAYNALSPQNKEKVSNYGKLTAAEAAYANIAVEALQNRINNLAAPSSASGREAMEALLGEYESVSAAYGALDDGQKGQITGYGKVTEGIAALQDMLRPYDLADMIDALPASGWTSSDHSAISAAKQLYNSLTAEQKAVLTQEQTAKLEAAIAYYDEEMAKTVIVLFSKSNTADYYSSLGVTITQGNYKSGETYTCNGQTYSDPLKIESSTSVTITVGAGKTVSLYISKADGAIKVDGTSYEAVNGCVTVTGLSEGTHVITKGDSCNLYYIVMN